MLTRSAAGTALGALDIFHDPWLDVLIPLLAGGGVIGVAVYLYRLELKQSASIAATAESDREFQHLQRRTRRRQQIAGLIGGIGVLLTLANSRVPWTKYPWAVPVYLVILLGLVVWILLLALGDMLSTQVFTRTQLAEVRRKQMELTRSVLERKRADSPNIRPDQN